MADQLTQQANNAVQTVQNPNVPAGQDPNAALFASSGSTLAPTQNSTTPNVMSPNQAFNNSQIPVPKVESPDPSHSLVAGAQQTSQSLQDYITSLTPAPTATDTKQQSILDSIAALTGQDTGRQQAQIDAEKASGATQAAQELKDLNNQLLVANAQYEKQFANLGGNGAVETVGVLNAQQAGLRRAQAADIGLLTARIQAKQGDLTLAQNTANRAVDAKYSVIEDQIKTQMAQLQAIQPQLDKEQKLQALAQQQMLQDKAQKLADEKAQAKENVNLALTAGITTKFVNKNGQFFDAATGQPFSDPAAFFKAAGVTSFEQAYKQGLVTDYSPAKIEDKNFVAQLAAKYPDAGIKLSDSSDVAQSKLGNSRIYKKETYIKPEPGGNNSNGVYIPGANPQVDAYVTAIKNGNATLTNVPAALRGLVAVGLSQGNSIVDPSIDQQVRAIIAANPDSGKEGGTGYGTAADAINKIQPGLASKYDAQLRAHYLDKKSVGEAFNNDIYSPLAATRLTTASNRIVSNFEKLPQYQLTANGLPYLQRIQAAIQTPGSISDQDLLDSLTKLNTSGNAITDAQVRLITDGKSYSDIVNSWKNKFDNGGVLSPSQRQQIVDIAGAIYANYQKGYQPVYEQVTKQLTDAGIPKQFWTIPDLNSLSAQSGFGGGNSGQPEQMNLNGQILHLQPDGTYQ